MSASVGAIHNGLTRGQIRSEDLGLQNEASFARDSLELDLEETLEHDDWHGKDPVVELYVESAVLLGAARVRNHEPLPTRQELSGLLKVLGKLFDDLFRF